MLHLKQKMMLNSPSTVLEQKKVKANQIDNKKWILGKTFSAADIYLYMLTTWLEPSRGHPKLSNFPNVKRVAKQASARSSIKLVYG